MSLTEHFNDLLQTTKKKKKQELFCYATTNNKKIERFCYLIENLLQKITFLLTNGLLKIKKYNFFGI